MTTKTITVDSAYIEASNVNNWMLKELLVNKNVEKLALSAIEYEDRMNILSGDILGLMPSQLQQIQNQCLIVVNEAKQLNIEINLYEKLLPVNINDTTETVTVVGKRLYPRTETVVIEGTPVEVEQPVEPVETPIEETPEEDAIDEIFSVIDADAEQAAVLALEEPISALGRENVAMISSELVSIAEKAAANTKGLQAGLVEFSTNPVAPVISNIRTLVLNYSNLNTALSLINSSPSLSSEYTTLRESLGGGDGLSASVSQLDNFKEHTDRISGLVLDKSSSLAEPNSDSTQEYLSYDAIPANTLTTIISFNNLKFRSAKYMVQCTAGRDHQATELYILHNNKFVFTREVTSIYTRDPFVTFTSAMINGNIEIKANSTQQNTDFVVFGTRLRIARQSKPYSDMSQTRILTLHEALSSFYNDGTDWAMRMSGSLIKGNLVLELGRTIDEMLTVLSSVYFSTLSTVDQKAKILEYANLIDARNRAIQDSIDADYDAFVECTKKSEALTVAFSLADNFKESGTQAVLDLTLNNQTKSAINAASELG
jgi:hypothetical protein